MKAAETNYNNKNLKHIVEVTQFHTAMPFNDISGIIYHRATKNVRSLIMFTDKDITDTTWFEDNKDYIKKTWTNADEPLAYVARIDLAVRHGKLEDMDQDLLAVENKLIAEQYQIAMSKGVMRGQFIRMSGVTRYRVDHALKKWA